MHQAETTNVNRTPLDVISCQLQVGIILWWKSFPDRQRPCEQTSAPICVQRWVLVTPVANAHSGGIGEIGADEPNSLFFWQTCLSTLPVCSTPKCAPPSASRRLVRPATM